MFGCAGRVKPDQTPAQPKRQPSAEELETTETHVLVFTDIQDSTKLWQAIPDTMPTLLATHDECVRALIQAHGGYEVKTEGDAFMISFTSAGDAVEVDATTGERLAGLRAHKRDSLRAVTERAMEYCAAVGAHVVGEPGPCGAAMAQQMWACLSGVFEESFSGAVDEDGSSSRWLVNERVAAGFTDLCQLARVHDDVFATFRGHPAMVNIIEHVTAEQGEAYLTLLR